MKTFLSDKQEQLVKMVHKKILITTYFFYPDNSPRAYRITALAKMLTLKGHQVTVITNTAYNYDEFTKDNGIEVISLCKPTSDAVKRKPLKFSTANSNHAFYKIISPVKTLIRKSLLYFIPDGHLLPFSLRLNRCLRGIQLNHFDVVISNANPFMVHLSTSLCLKRFKGIAIAETGDPYFYNHYRLAPYQANIENWVLTQFTYITVPVERAVADYGNYGMIDKVRVIPHGFFFDEVQLKSYRPSETVKFAFAGRLYKEIRNPTQFLNSLVNNYSDYPFVFHIYTDLRNKETLELLLPFKLLLGDKIKIQDMLQRTDCIRELSSMDFLVNFENDTSNQVPSKLVDYTLSERPIISINHNFDNKELFSNYIRHDFKAFKPLDISSFNISNVVSKFESLF
ncbi:glycosyltransferase [Paraglaciecola sp.]|uniref:glycosyltransferase n=1 Tax=Paraglaciecola sp. TaxID=1920173 RepID=UPI0030F372A5